MIEVSLHIIAFKHKIKDLKVRGDKKHVDENVSEHHGRRQKIKE